MVLFPSQVSPQFMLYLVGLGSGSRRSPDSYFLGCLVERTEIREDQCKVKAFYYGHCRKLYKATLGKRGVLRAEIPLNLGGGPVLWFRGPGFTPLRVNT